jgi:Immunoglobulin domain
LGSLRVTRSTFASNVVTGGAGGGGGNGRQQQDPHLGGNGGRGGDGRSGLGGALFNNGAASLVNCTIAFNTGNGGAGGGGGAGALGYDYGGSGGAGGNGGSGFGGVDGACNLTNCTVAWNLGNAGSGGAGGAAGFSPQHPGTPGAPGGSGAAWGGTVCSTLVNTLIASNTPAGNDSFTDPKLGSLADNGGPTLTMRLLPGSPAIDAGDNALAPATDQRGAPRPVGLACDIGAYEYDPLILATPPPTQTVESGDVVNLAALVTGFPPPTYQWFFNGNALTGCTNSVLCLSGIQASNVGAYTLVVSNATGAITSAPAMLNVIPAVERKPVLGLKVTGETGSLLNVDYANSLSLAPNWTTLGSVSLTSTSQYYFDLTSPLPPQRFYRAWQKGTPSMVPSLNLNFVPAITLTGNVGDSFRLDYINAIGPTDAWVTLDTVTLTNTPQLYFDISALGQPQRLYRIAPVP